jgi:beta-lactam-binding protein with PASTA domain
MLGDSVRRRQPKRRQGGEPARPQQGRRKWRPLLLALPLALTLPFLIGYLLAVHVIFPPQQASGAGIPVPELVGLSSLDAQRALVAAGLGPLEPSELPHPTAPAGQVIAQSPLAGQQLRAGAGVRVALSAGRPRVVVPDVRGFTAERAQSLLQRSGFDVTHTTEESPTAEGRVLRTDPPPGEQRTLPAVVTLVVSAGPPPPVEPDTIFGDTPAVPPPGW